MSVVQVPVSLVSVPLGCADPAASAGDDSAYDGSVEVTGPARDDAEPAWAEQTRRVLSRDLLTRAAHARPGEARALEFRALHLNLSVVDEVVARLGLTAAQRTQVEHHALDGLHEAVRRYDPCGAVEFPEFAAAYVEEQIRAHLPRPSLRLVAHRVAVALARV